MKHLKQFKNISIFLLTPKKIPKTNSITYFSHRNIIKSLDYVSILDDINPFRIQKIIQIIKDYQIDIIQNENPNGFLNLIPVKKSGIPIIVDEHDFSYLFSKEINRNRLIQQYILWLEKLATKYSDHILTVSQFDKIQITKFYNLSPDKISVIPNGADIHKFRPINPSEKLKRKEKYGFKDQFILFYHGAPFHKPNRDAFKNLIRLGPRLKEKIPNLQIILVGNPYTNYDSDYIRSFPPLDDLASYISIADVAVIPITSGSGTRLKLLDYLASGIAVVSTRKGAEGIEIKNKKHALLSSEIDHNFINYIINLYENDEWKDKIAKAGRTLAENLYDWGKISKKLYGIYQKIMK